jgi:hypothetical protein
MMKPTTKRNQLMELFWTDSANEMLDLLGGRGASGVGVEQRFGKHQTGFSGLPLRGDVGARTSDHH